LKGIGQPLFDCFRQAKEVKHAPNTDAFIMDATCRFGDAVILRHPSFAAEYRIQKGMGMLAEESGWPPSPLFLLPKEPDGESQADYLISVVHLIGTPTCR
jgi:hypothetical protein